MSTGRWLKTQMKQKLKAIFKGPVVFYPLLFAAFPILFLYAHNISETSASQMWLSLVISVAATLVLWAVLSLILRSLAKAGFATAIFLVFFFSYGRLYDGLNYLGVFVPKHAYLLPAMLFVWGYCVYFIGRAKRDFRITTRLFNIAAVVLIAINLFNIGSYQVRLARLSADTPVESTEHTAASPAELNTLPDIYFIILDEYAHPDTMKEWYDYDNSEFINSLEDKGFFVAHESRTRTRSTAYSIASTLNMEYTSLAAPLEIVKQMIATNKVVDFLNQRGYRYAYFQIDNWWRGTYGVDTDLPVDFQSPERNHLMTDFSRLLWNTTMLCPFYNHIYGTEYIRSWRNGLLDTLSHLKTMPDIEGPKIVIAHLMCPHEAFVFGPKGEYIAPANWSNYKDKQFYLGQYIFISAEIEKVIDVLLDKSEMPPIIILQSDHGIRPYHPGIVIGGDEWEKILNAMYLPGMDADMLYDNISTVNTFRLIFNHYF
ncbi:MAG TPA: hypothetical protein VMW50_06540, partial [Dehalococcoidia bacterium]|nr:hypothetical protein [Dehalococcoidia bacterium]